MLSSLVYTYSVTYSVHTFLRPRRLRLVVLNVQKLGHVNMEVFFLLSTLQGTSKLLKSWT